MTPDIVRHTYNQDADCCQPTRMGETQTLEVETADGGGGQYLVLSTRRWALDADSLDALVADLRRVLETVEPPKASTEGGRDAL